LAGLSVPIWLDGGYSPGKPRLLTVKKVENLRWMKSDRGQLARNILMKVGAEDRAQAAVHALHYGLLD
jgi:hypothetical protein